MDLKTKLQEALRRKVKNGGAVITWISEDAEMFTAIDNSLPSGITCFSGTFVQIEGEEVYIRERYNEIYFLNSELSDVGITRM